MPEKKLNCWEFKECGRQPGGRRTEELGVCPASIDESFDGINDGQNAGRFCWAVTGTCCGGKVQGTYAQKRKSCVSCKFYRHVREQEGSSDIANKIFDIFSEKKSRHYLEMITCQKIKAGERFVRQGEIRDSAYIIQSGTCLSVVEKKAELHPICHRGPGNIIGLTSLLTGEPQTSHAEAETDMDALVIEKQMFEEVASKGPELMEFLTEIVASRFDSNRPIADRTIGKYAAVDIIGRGGFSIVYRGIHKSLNMPVAIKMMKHDMALDEDFIRGFKNEAHTIAKLNHDNIVRIYDIEERFKTLFIIMEYLEGLTLGDVLKNMYKLKPARAVNYLIQTARGLHYAHQKGIIHGDIKPDNLFVTPEGRVKILDFGLACPTGSENFMEGSPFYMAPEQIEGLAIDERTDIYSFGLTAFKMVTGVRPYPDEDVFIVSQKHVGEDIPDPGKINGKLPEAFRNLILKASARQPEKRYQHTGELLGDLIPLANDLGIKAKDPNSKQRKLATLFLIYEDDHQTDVNHLLDDFITKAQDIGVDLKTANFKNI